MYRTDIHPDQRYLLSLDLNPWTEVGRLTSNPQTVDMSAWDIADEYEDTTLTLILYDNSQGELIAASPNFDWYNTDPGENPFVLVDSGTYSITRGSSYVFNFRNIGTVEGSGSKDKVSLHYAGEPSPLEFLDYSHPTLFIDADLKGTFTGSDSN